MKYLCEKRVVSGIRHDTSQLPEAQINDPKLGLAHYMQKEPYAPVVSVCLVGL